MARTKRTTDLKKSTAAESRKLEHNTPEIPNNNANLVKDEMFHRQSSVSDNLTNHMDESFIVSNLSLKDNTQQEESKLEPANSENTGLLVPEHKIDTSLEIENIQENSIIASKKNPLFILDTSTIKSLYNDFVNLDMPISEFISQLPALHQKQIKRLCMITMNKNICIDDLTRLTISKDRNIRFLSTTCVLHKIKANFATKSKNDYTKILLDIIESRTKDIDHNIRSVCYEYLIDMHKYLDIAAKHINNGLDDKSDSVRKKTIKGLQQIVDTKNIFKYKNKIINLCQHDKNPCNKKEACKLLLCMFNSQMVESEEIFSVLDNFSINEMQDLFEHLVIGKGVVEVIQSFNQNGIRKITLKDEFMKELVDKVLLDEQLLQILSLVIKPRNNIIKDLIYFLEVFKEKTQNIIYIIDALQTIDQKYYTAEYETLVDILHDILSNYNNAEIAEKVFKLYFKLFNSYTKVNIVLERIKYGKNDAFITHALKYFDFSDFVTQNHTFETKLLACFWKIEKEDFASILDLNLTLLTSRDFEIACTYILHLENIIRERIDSNNIYDSNTALNYIFRTLCSHATLYLDNYDKSVVHCYLKVSHILSAHKYIFTCQRHDIVTYLNNIKSIDDIVLDYFFDRIFNCDNLSLGDIRIISLTICKKIKSCKVYNWLIRLKDADKFYDNCFVYFVKFLTVGECDTLLKTVKYNCKYKTLLTKKLSYKQKNKNGKENQGNLSIDKSNENIGDEAIDPKNESNEEKEIVHL